MLAFHVLTCICTTTFYDQYAVGLRDSVNHRVRLGVGLAFSVRFSVFCFVFLQKLLEAWLSV